MTWYNDQDISSEYTKQSKYESSQCLVAQLFLEAGLSSELHLFSDPVEFKCLLP